MAVARKPFFTPDQYLELERKAEFRSEYLAGEIIAMAGASLEHGVIIGNLVRALSTRLDDRPCLTVPNDLKVQVQGTGLYTYPDVVVACGDPQFRDEHRDTLLNPTLIIEVLSPSTESYDRGEKFAHYRRIASLQEYILVSQDRPRLERYVRQSEAGELWLFSVVEGIEVTATLAAIDCTVPLSEIYRKINFPTVDRDG